MNFARAFESLTGQTPFPWQRELFSRMMQGRMPRSCDIPTGMGKTSVIPIWLLALAQSAEAGACRIPRRLAYVINRRTVVDQATTVAERLQERLTASAAPEVAELRQLLARISGDADDLLAVSTLRGQRADNGEWAENPVRPAIVIGTVDMIGSRLLFSGYRIGFRQRPHHAGLLGQDTLLIHDEAHLEPAFQTLLEEIVEEQARDGTESVPWPKLQVMAMSATLRDADGDSLALSGEDRSHEVIRQRLTAPKRLALHALEKTTDGEVSAKLAELASRHDASHGTVLVYAEKVEVAEKAAKTLRKLCPRSSVLLLTGTLRGRERDQLAAKPAFQRFLPPWQRTVETVPEETCYLVCTSAGEVGVDISADHLVCDLSTFDSLLQRFGRVNRFGFCKDCCVDVLHPKTFAKADEESANDVETDEEIEEETEEEQGDEDEAESKGSGKKKKNDMQKLREAAKAATLKLLRQLEGDVSLASLQRLPVEERLAGFSPSSRVLPAASLFDAWALTTPSDGGEARVDVEPFLHGFDFDAPDTYIAWRREVAEIANELLVEYPPSELLEDYPIRPHETLRDRSDRVRKRLAEMAKRHSPQTSVWLVHPEGTVDVLSLEQLIAGPKASLDNCLVLLPPGVGGLTEDGIFDPKSHSGDDIADITEGPEQRRRLMGKDNEYNRSPEWRLVRSIPLSCDEESEEDAEWWQWYVHRDGETEAESRRAVLLSVHTEDVLRLVRHYCRVLGLPEPLTLAFELAATYHDEGKARSQFQRLLGNYRTEEIPWAKGNEFARRSREAYRHEFGSLLDFLRSHRNERSLAAELAAHLIAAHHGRARPHFPEEEAFDCGQWLHPELCRQVVKEAMQRFARLQRRFGRWGLAYLEALLRAADWAASAHPSKFVEEPEEPPEAVGGAEETIEEVV